MRPSAVSVLLAALVVACGSSGPPAPPIDATTQLCTDDFCVTAPEGWAGSIVEGAISFSHPLSEDATAFISVVDMAWLLESTGSSWPATLDSVERAYWSLLDIPPMVPQQVLVSPDGWSESKGRFEGFPRWHSFRPIDGGPAAVAVTIQLPGDDWDAHARTFLEGVTLLR